MYIYANKELTLNLIKFSKEENYLVNSNNNIVYSSLEKGVSIEYAVDKFFGKNIKGLFVYENIENDEISIVFINNTKKTINFNIKSDFSTKKLENFIKLICFQENIFNVYFFENSKAYQGLMIPEYININFVERAKFKKVLKSSPALKNNQNKVFSLIVFLILIFGISYGFDRLFNYLTIKSSMSFDAKMKVFTEKKFALEDELNKYENLTQNLKDISVVKVISEYKEIKNKEQIEGTSNIEENKDSLEGIIR